MWGAVRISHARVVDPGSEAASGPTDVLIEDGVVKSVRASRSRSGIDVYDAGGRWIIPSLIDLHTHVTFESRAHLISGYEYAEDEPLSLLRGAANLERALQSGVCMVRDLGSVGGRDLALKGFTEAGKLILPTIVTSGASVCHDGGHGWQFGQVLQGEAGVRALIVRHASAGHRWVKVMNDPERFNLSTLSKLVSCAHGLGMRVAVHAFTQPSVYDAVVAGADTIEHGLALDRQTANAARKAGTVFVPTLYCAWRSVQKDYQAATTASEFAILMEWYQMLVDGFKRHLGFGLPTAIGTDAGAAPCGFEDIAGEVAMLHQNGMPLAEAVRGATSLAAAALGADAEFGHVRKGAWGNLLLVSANPLTDVHALETVEAIWWRGVQVRGNGRQGC